MSKIYGIALTKDGEPVAGVEVVLSNSALETTGSHTTGDDGIFEFEVETGTWNFKWTPTGGDSNEGQVEVSEGEDAEVELEIG